MTRERFSGLLKKKGYSEDSIEIMWNSRSTDDLDEDAILKAAEGIAAFRKAITLKRKERKGGSDGKGGIC